MTWRYCCCCSTLFVLLLYTLTLTLAEDERARWMDASSGFLLWCEVHEHVTG